MCPVPFLRAGWLGVTLSLSTSLPAPQDPVAISNQLRELASPLLQPIAFPSLCHCVHACEWAGAPFLCLCACVCVCTHIWIWLYDSNMIGYIRADYWIKCSLTVTHLFLIYSYKDKGFPAALYPHSDRGGKKKRKTHTCNSQQAWRTKNCIPRGSGQWKIINRCWLGLLSTFVLHGKQHPFFCTGGNQYCDLCLGRAAHLTEQRKERYTPTACEMRLKSTRPW